MKIKHAMILAAGLGTRMKPITLKTPKSLIKIGNKNLLERAINLLEKYGVEEITINTHHLGHLIEKFILGLKIKVKLNVSNEKDLLLDTGGGAKKGTKMFHKNPFFVINPDTIWTNNYLEEMKYLEKIYFKNKNPALLLVSKKLSFDPSFTGDFNLNNNLISKDNKNEFIFTGLQILDKKSLNLVNKNVFSMNEVWSTLINEKKLYGIQSNQKFYHLNTKKIYEKILSLNIIN